MAYRIATVTYDWYPHEPRALRMIEAAVDGGYEVDVLCAARPAMKRFEVDGNTRIYRLPVPRVYDGSLLKTIIGWLAFLPVAGIALVWLQARRRYDVIHVHNLPDFLVFCALVPKLMGAKVILDVQDVSPELMAAKAGGSRRMRNLVVRLAKWQERAAVAFADHVLTTGDIFEDILLRRGVPRRKLSSVLNSADPNLFNPSRSKPPYLGRSESDRPFTFMYHGTLAQRNGLDIAVRALAIARRCVQNLRLEIQGSGDQLPYLKRLAHELGIDDAVGFRGLTELDGIAGFIEQGDVGIIPYRYTGFSEYVLPTKAYEYAWMQRPIIASDTVAIRSMFRPESIVLCDPERPETFAEAMIDLYHNPTKRARLIADAAEDYVPFRWEAMAQRYRDLLASLIEKRSAVGYA